MRFWHRTALLALFASTLHLTSANELELDQGENQQQCAGMYSKKAWGGNKDPAITVKIATTGVHDIVSLVIFEFEDESYLGRRLREDSWQKDYICTPDATEAGFCKKEDLGKFILEENTNSSSTGSIYTEAIHLDEANPIKYDIKRTGYYCVWTNPYTPADLEYEGVVVFQNAYGELPAAQIAKLAFYGGLTIVYAVVFAAWAFLYVQHRSDILPVQNYITAIILFLIVEMLMTWAFYEYQNVHGNNTLAKVLMIIVAILNAGRNSFSFFLLLIVCMGYGVVKHTLGSLMKWVRILAATHFVFGVIYAVASLTITPESAGPLVLLVILPLAATLTAFYVWTLNSLKLTRLDLLERKQHTKLLMYNRLWWSLVGSIVVIFGFFFLNSLTFAGHSSPDFVPTHWKTRWFVLDGWLNLVYLANLCIIAYLWRPTANNRRFAMSDEIAQDDDGGFEIASIGGSELDEDDAEEGRAGLRDVSPRPSDERTRAPRRKSLDGSDDEPIFEVGDGDGWSDDDEDLKADKAKDGPEAKKLTSKDD